MSIQATRMQDWRIRSANLYKNEFAAKLYGAMDFFVAQNHVPGAIVTDELRARAQGSTGNTIVIPVLQRNTTAAVGTSRSCTVTNNETSSALQSLSWTTVTDGFAMFPNRYMNNDITYQQHFDANMRDMLRRIAVKIDQLCLANLSSNKNAVWSDLLNYSQSSNVVNAGWNDRFDFVGDINSIMLANGFMGGLNVIGNAGTLNLFNKLAEHDIYNAVNKRYEYADKSLWLTHQLTNDTNKYATMYIIPDGQVGILTRVSRAEYNHSKANEHEWGETFLPYMGDLKFGTHFYTVAGDVHTAADESDMICDYGEYYGFAIDIAFINAYNSTPATVPNPIVKADIASGSNGVTNVNVVNTSDSPVYTSAV